MMKTSSEVFPDDDTEVDDSVGGRYAPVRSRSKIYVRLLLSLFGNTFLYVVHSHDPGGGCATGHRAATIIFAKALNGVMWDSNLT